MKFRDLILETYGEEELRPLIRLSKKIKHQLLKQDRDVVLGITGFEGEGKSTLAVILAIFTDPLFDFDLNVSYLPSAEEITKEFNDLKPGQVYLVDEAIKGLYKMNFQSALQQTIIKMYATERYQNKCTLLLMPRFTDFTENFRNHRIRTWINVIDRGKAVVYIKDRDQTTQDPWHLLDAKKQKYKLLKKRISTVSVDERIREERKLPTYLMDFEFPDLPKDIKKIYVDKKIESRMREVIDPLKSEERKDHKYITLGKKRLVKACYLLEKRLRMNRRMVSKYIDMPYEKYSEMMNNEEYGVGKALTLNSNPLTVTNIYDKRETSRKNPNDRVI